MDEHHRPPQATRRRAPVDETRRANRTWWDGESTAYQAEHGRFLGDVRFVWGPEGLDEADAGLLGPVSSLAGLRVLEIGCGAAPCGRWLAAQGAQVVSSDLSAGMLAQARLADVRAGVRTPLLQADACRLPLADASVDLACSAYGAVPFVADSAGLMAEVARVLRPGGRWVFSVTHPVRWAFPDEPGPEGLVARESYFDRTPYVEQGADGVAEYVEHHRTLGDRVRELVAAGLVLDDLVEPEWPAGHDEAWGGWSPLRGRVLPGTAIFVSHRP
ncbi:class I SAM-dependent methyltransferase [Angustibacter aerolatus]|uniref:SAM-dependent methyltransferase n=1 Tax=Angustibacter aerolatus TaxID=1162965 RepID=A0ABQ6JC48_9ACTN|nr:class I SAM-dependent methyltransferase [Angustibacter aerolatus]GMA85038.1 SAM-dependent methyltransferase [Angustibacter aerolatus]